MKHNCDGMKNLWNTTIEMYHGDWVLIDETYSLRSIVFINYCPWCGEKFK